MWIFLIFYVHLFLQFGWGKWSIKTDWHNCNLQTVWKAVLIEFAPSKWQKTDPHQMSKQNHIWKWISFHISGFFHLVEEMPSAIEIFNQHLPKTYFCLIRSWTGKFMVHKLRFLWERKNPFSIPRDLWRIPLICSGMGKNQLYCNRKEEAVSTNYQYLLYPM